MIDIVTKTYMLNSWREIIIKSRVEKSEPLTRSKSCPDPCGTNVPLGRYSYLKYYF